MINDPRAYLIAAARQFHQLGWMVGTAGNLSARVSDDSFWITASGKSKGKLTETDFVRVSFDGTLLESPHPHSRPSAETSIHQAIYRLFPEAQACYHVHSVEANLVSRLAVNDLLPLPPIEMVKGLGVWEEEPQVAIPVFENYADVPKIAQTICDRLIKTAPDVPALLIKHHGVTVWADSLEKAENYLEVAEYLFRYILAEKQMSFANMT